MIPASVRRASCAARRTPGTFNPSGEENLSKQGRYQQLRNKPRQKGEWWYTCSFCRGRLNICPRVAGGTFAGASSGARSVRATKMQNPATIEYTRLVSRSTDLEDFLNGLDPVWTLGSKTKSQDGMGVGLYLDYLDQYLYEGYTRVRGPLSSRLASCLYPQRDLVQMVQIGVRPSAVLWFSVGLSRPNRGPIAPSTRSKWGEAA